MKLKINLVEIFVGVFVDLFSASYVFLSSLQETLSYLWSDRSLNFITEILHRLFFNSLSYRRIKRMVFPMSDQKTQFIRQKGFVSENKILNTPYYLVHKLQFALKRGAAEP